MRDGSRGESIEATMAKTILIAGYGPGVSTAVAEKFGSEGFQIAIVGRNADKLAAGAKALEAKGWKAAAFVGDMADPRAIRDVVEKTRAALGPITVLEWTAFTPGSEGADLLTCSDEELRSLFDIAVRGLLVAVRAALPDLKSEKGAVLVTNGGAGFVDPQVDAMIVRYGMMGLGVSNAAKHKLVGLLAEKLEPDGVFVGEVMISGAVKGTAFDTGALPSIDPDAIAARYWEMYTERKDIRATFR